MTIFEYYKYSFQIKKTTNKPEFEANDYLKCYEIKTKYAILTSCKDKFPCRADEKYMFFIEKNNQTRRVVGSWVKKLYKLMEQKHMKSK